MNSADPLQGPATSPPRHGWGQFSLLSMLGIVIFGCLAAAWYGEKRRADQALAEVRRSEAEIRELRIALGILDDEPDFLTITDKKQVYVRAIPTHDELHWRWRIYLPPSTDWEIEMTEGERWNTQGARYMGGGASTNVKLSGEFMLDARLTRDADGRAHIEIVQGRSTTRVFLRDASIAVLLGGGKRTLQVGGAGKQVTHERPGPIELVRWYREAETNAAQGHPTDLAPRDGWGISIQIEERAHKAARMQKLRAEAKL
jgi:hypothetical protein